MRWIAPQEKCLTAAEIAARFYELSGVALQPVNVGNAAKALGLDYLEVEDPDALNPEWGKKRKLYAEPSGMPALIHSVETESEDIFPRKPIIRSQRQARQTCIKCNRITAGQT